ncbi:MAG: hypothetical protein U0Y82_16770 [Thermoleophilia bacterium]
MPITETATYPADVLNDPRVLAQWTQWAQENPEEAQRTGVADELATHRQLAALNQQEAAQRQQQSEQDSAVLAMTARVIDNPGGTVQLGRDVLRLARLTRNAMGRATVNRRLRVGTMYVDKLVIQNRK